MVTSINKLINLLLMDGMLNLYRVDLKLKITLKESMESWTSTTVVKLVRILNKEIPSLFSGRLPD